MYLAATVHFYPHPGFILNLQADFFFLASNIHSVYHTVEVVMGCDGVDVQGSNTR